MLNSWFSLLFLQGLVIGSVLAACDFRFYRHYEHKGCSPVLGLDGCPSRYQCESITEDVRQRCRHGGRWYNPGERIASDDGCDSCRCVTKGLRGAAIECAEVDCPDWEAQNKACYMGYKNIKDCCPIEMCPKGNEEQKTCEGDFRPGQVMPGEFPCQFRICREDGEPECRRVQCLTGIRAPAIREGCLVIYGEKSCCDTGVHCGGIQGATPVKQPIENTEDLCRYREIYYPKGAKATLTDFSYGCVECECSVPPDFTCIRKPC